MKNKKTDNKSEFKTKENLKKINSIKNIYLAGKISYFSEDWRRDILFSENNHHRSPEMLKDGFAEDITEIHQWPILKNQVLNIHNFTGPYFISCDHGCFHGQNNHGVGIIDNTCSGGRGEGEYCNCRSDSYVNCGCEINKRNILKRQKRTVLLCNKAIENSDIIFAWITENTCYGTITEIGYAKGNGKTVWIAGPNEIKDMWFTYNLADKFSFNFQNPKEALNFFLDTFHIFKSPIEQTFYDNWNKKNHNYKLEFQYPILNYFVDFVHLDSKTIIELDGHETHSSPDAIAYDRKRQRDIESVGWKVIRFGGKEIYSNVELCVNETIQIINQSLKPVE